MNHSEFQIGSHFKCSGRRWLCTDLGTRVVVAVPADNAEFVVIKDGVKRRETRPLAPQDLSGPPYSIAEHVFDEYDLEACSTDEHGEK